jgi:hypothetical protein
MGSNTSQHLKIFGTQTEEEVLIFNPFLKKRLAVRAIDTSFKIILLFDIF